MVVLQGVGVSPTLAVRIHRKLGAQALRVVRQEPYRLVEEVHGIGFATADRIALALGIPEQSPERIKAALLHALDQARTMAGHCYLLHDTLIDKAVALIGQDSELVRPALHQLRKKRKVVIEGTPGGAPGDAVVFPAWLHRAETMLADNLVRHLHAPSQMPGRARFVAMTDASPVDDTNPQLDPRQLAAVRMALTQTVSILTGGPGCGKSFTIREVAARVRAAGAKVTLAAPTGRAAKRLSELTGLSAMTVHRLVRPRPAPDTDGSLFDPGDALQADLIVVDEASMLDLPLADELVSKIPPGCHLLFVGDVDQLPSVGPGCVLRDLLDVPQIPSVRLERVYRQGPGSSITANADRVRRGRMPTNSAEFWFVPVDDASAIAETVVDIATRRLPEAYHLDPGEVQVLCPGRGKHAGAVNLGRLIQDKRNPHRDEQPQHWADDRAFRVGDRVMPTRNNYDKGRQGVFNGSAGTVTALDTQQRRLDVRLDDGETVTYDFDELDDLAHAFAITVHRSQGSEYPYVVVALSTASGPFLLRRNLLYTAITRAKTMVVVVGEPGALTMALRHDVQRRNTGLVARLREQPPTFHQIPLLPYEDDQIAAF
jgi:exodeoxyribonuclease V alpha subunit